MRGLVIDDSKAMRSILKGMLKGFGFEVFEAGDGREGIQTLEKIEDPNLVLVDWNMPVMTGIEFVAQVRSDPTYKNVTVVMVTSETEMSQVAKALEAGADEYMMKPFTKDILHEKLQLLGLPV